MAVGRRRALLGLAVAVAVVSAVGVATAASAPPLSGEDAQMDVEADTVSLRVDLQESGTAAWRVTYRIELADENETDAFRSLRDDIRADPGPYLDRFGSRMRRATWSAENATGRAMRVENLSVEARIASLPQGRYGVVEYRFEWTGFAVVEGERLRAGDAIEQFFLDERTSLTIAWPDGYGLVSHSPEATTVEDGAVIWEGRRDFGPGEPSVVVDRGAGSPTPGGGLPFLALAAAAVVLLAAGGWAFFRRRGAGPATAGSDVDESAEPPPELLSNEERVLRLLEEHGGRIKQQEVADRLEWTDAKTSQVVGQLREADELESFRLGRENVLTLPDVSIEPEDSEPDP